MMQLAVVVPCFNEEPVLRETISRLRSLLADLNRKGKIAANSSIYLVDDGSTDGTWEIICEEAAVHGNVRGVKLSRNRGHQNALLAGVSSAEGDAVVTIDADLQDDIAVIETMVDYKAAGIDIVYGVRKSRQVDASFKRFTAEFYYRFLAKMGVQVIFNHADYRLMSRRALDALSQYGEVNLFLRGIIPQLGFPTAIATYDRSERFAGESKYPLTKMLALAVNGVTSFSVVPLRMIAALGLLICMFSAAMIVWVLIGSLVFHSVLPGWASAVIPTYLLGGIQLFSIGIIGEYVGKIYLEAKHRPRFFIQDTV